MMGPVRRRDPKLFYTDLNIEDRIPADDPLRQVAKAIDFDFVRGRVRHLYGRRGNSSVDRAVLLKLMFLPYYENVASERKLMEKAPVRLDWLWFCGFDLGGVIPDHGAISKARRRWGAEVFQRFFARVLAQCIKAGLVDGHVVHVDSSLIEASADRQRLGPSPLDQHQFNAKQAAETVVADKAYGTGENYQHLHRRDIRPCVPHQTHVAVKGKFSANHFRYDPRAGGFVCPAGHFLPRWNREPSERRTRYKAHPLQWAACPLKNRCT